MEDKIAEIITQLTSMNAGRADFYLRLSQLMFKEVTSEEIERLKATDFTGMDGGDELIAAGYSDIHGALRRANSGTRQELAVDYARTFLAAGNYETFAATPYESVFTSSTGLMMQEARDEVYKMYCAEHIQPDAKLQVPEDHLAFEFEFLAHLLTELNKALEARDWDRAQTVSDEMVRFHQEHQLNWVDDFCDAIMDSCKTRFYRGVSKIIRGFTHMETDVIADENEVIADLREADQQENAD